MRSQQLTIPALVGAGPITQMLSPDATRGIIMVRNTDAANTLMLQSGKSAGSPADFFDVKPGEVFTLDPTEALAYITQDAWWAYGLGGSVSIKLFAG